MGLYMVKPMASQKSARETHSCWMNSVAVDVLLEGAQDEVEVGSQQMANVTTTSTMVFTNWARRHSGHSAARMPQDPPVFPRVRVRSILMPA